MNALVRTLASVGIATLMTAGCFLEENPSTPSRVVVSDTTITVNSTYDVVKSDTVVIDTIDYDDGGSGASVITVLNLRIRDTITTLQTEIESTIVDSVFVDDDSVRSDTTVRADTSAADAVPVDTTYNDTTIYDTIVVPHLIVATTAATDYSSGNVGVLMEPAHAAHKDLLSIHSDNIVRCKGSAIYILERLGKDNLIRLDSSSLYSGGVVYQQSLGSGVNLQDIAFADSDKGYVTQYQAPGVLVVDLGDGSVADTIDLSDYNTTYADHPDSTEDWPFMSSALVLGDNLYVACQRMRSVTTDWGISFEPADTSLIVVISTATDAVVETIALEKKNPYGMDVAAGKLYVSSTGSWADPTDGGVERIDPATNTNEGVVAEESTFGGNISTIVMVNENKGYVAVGKNSADFSEFWTELVEFDPSAGTVGEAVDGVDDAFGGAVYNGRYLYVGDRNTAAPGVVVIDPADNSTVAGPLDVGIAPSSLSVLVME